jgi:hypothetical protein
MYTYLPFFLIRRMQEQRLPFTLILDDSLGLSNIEPPKGLAEGVCMPVVEDTHACVCVHVCWCVFACICALKVCMLVNECAYMHFIRACAYVFVCFRIHGKDKLAYTHIQISYTHRHTHVYPISNSHAQKT